MHEFQLMNTYLDHPHTHFFIAIHSKTNYPPLCKVSQWYANVVNEQENWLDSRHEWVKMSDDGKPWMNWKEIDF